MQQKPVKSFAYVLYSLLLTIITACGQLDVEQTLSDAESQLMSGNFDIAASSCEMLADTAEVQLTPTQMCRLAIIFAKLSEAVDNQDYMASATHCFERAQTLDNSADSLDTFIETLEVDDQSVIRVIKEVAHTMNTPYDFSKDNDEDIYSEFSHHDMSDLNDGTI